MRLLLAALLLLAAACSPVDAPVRCTPGAQYPCLCSPGDYRGAQTCEAGGASYTSCSCPSAPADVLPTDAVVAPDVVQLDAGAVEDRPAVADVVDVSLEDRPEVQQLDTPAADLGAEVGACGADATVCDAGCRDLTTDPLHCGACGNVCPTGNAHTRPVCFASACTLSCDEGWRNCDRDMRNGCEVHSAVDRMNCGTCGTICPLSEQCVMGTCRRP